MNLGFLLAGRKAEKNSLKTVHFKRSFFLHTFDHNNTLIFPVDLWRKAVIELKCKQHNFRGKKDEK